MASKSSSSQTNGGPSKAIGIGKTGPWGGKAPKPLGNFKPIKYGTKKK
jgi:hypothetical protein